MILTSAVMLMAVSAAWADVRVEILDHPAQVLQYSPVLITAQIVNDGPDPAIVAVGRWMTNGYFVETGPLDGELVKRSEFSGTRAYTGVKKLRPGGTWLFQLDVREWMSAPGQYRARVGVHGEGRCLLEKVVARDLEATLILDRRGSKRKGPAPYECWEGVVFSQEVTVQVNEPTSSIDTEALKYIMSPDYPVELGSELASLHFYRLMHGARYLKDRFPKSHYTYAAGYYGCGGTPVCIEDLLELQPGNPLEPYMRQQLALAMLKAGRADEVTSSFIESLQLPGGLKEYVDQRVAEHQRGQPHPTTAER